MGKEIPDKLFFKIGEVCELTDTQPYVLRFWESEFPQLAPRKNRSGQRVYRRDDILVVERIKHLLHDQGYTIAGARKRLEEELADDGSLPPAPETPIRPKETALPEPLRSRILDELRAVLKILDGGSSRGGR